MRVFLARQLRRLADFVEPKGDVWWENLSVTRTAPPGSFISIRE